MPKEGHFNNDYVLLLETENRIKLLEEFKGSKLHHLMKCLVCDHEWKATPISKRQTYKKYGASGCPKCNINRKEKNHTPARKQNIQKLLDRGIVVLDPDYDGRREPTNKSSDSKILVKNINCGHEFYCTPANLLSRHVTCGICGPQKRMIPLTTLAKHKSTKWKETATSWQTYKSIVSLLTEKTYHQYIKQINPTNLPRGKAGIIGAYHLDHIVPKRFCFDNNIPPEICAHYTNLQLIGWKENIGSGNNIKGTIPPLFFSYMSTNSKIEKYAELLQRILPNSKKFVNVADIIVTVYDEYTNRAIIVLPIDKSYANSKTLINAHKTLTEAKINCTLLFEDELVNLRLLTAKLKHYTQDSHVIKIHARKCIIKPCFPAEKRVILNENHIQGNDSAKLIYGAYFEDKLVAIMTFASPRIAVGARKENNVGIWELSRFCTDVNYRIPGIASKLLTYFKRNNEWTEIYSFADKRWSIGNMYTQLGFDLVANTPPSYFYVINGQRKHRWNYRKDVLKTKLPRYDSSLTEYQNMENHGYYRVWDCGALKFSMVNKND